MIMVNSPVVSASPGQEKSKHCESKAPVVDLGDVTRTMVTRQISEGNMGTNQSVVHDLPSLKQCEVRIVDCCHDIPEVTVQSSSSIPTPCEQCGKVFKGSKGVNIHRSMTQCGKRRESLVL